MHPVRPQPYGLVQWPSQEPTWKASKKFRLPKCAFTTTRLESNSFHGEEKSTSEPDLKLLLWRILPDTGSLKDHLCTHGQPAQPSSLTLTQRWQQNKPQVVTKPEELPLKYTATAKQGWGLDGLVFLLLLVFSQKKPEARTNHKNFQTEFNFCVSYLQLCWDLTFFVPSHLSPSCQSSWQSGKLVTQTRRQAQER